ncbi:glycine receptor subunit alphaZ1 [Exaiptasia diaphana]|uniref:Uncharacterized protein n=1 Tax=Exaiptasia diaphana TaxID=2652724 RepID=A0A913XEK9_EXADI|nr:glycine receptor subunit alphaZ1 [Exaiptasia diaphana]KXJ12727.1 Glycine receptor subunit alphaZ1 [Exaiptasia diaphana]
MKNYTEATKVILIVLASAILASGLDNHSLFINSLTNITNYDKRIRPYHLNSILNITVYMTIVSFGDVEEMKSEFSLDMFFEQQWYDPRLRHGEHGIITLTGTDRNLIWLPDTYFQNIKNAQHHDVPADNSRVTIDKQGHVHYSSRITLSASCEMDLHEYPLDTQTCMLEIMSYAYDDKDVNYRWKGDRNNAIRIMNDNLAQLALKDVHINYRKLPFGKSNYSELMAIFRFERRLGYSLLQIYAPTFLITCISWLSFWISKDAIPARIALGITTILTIVTLNGSFRSAVPKVSYIKAMDLYLIVSFLFVFGAVMEYIAVLSYIDLMNHRKSLEKKFDTSDTTTVDDEKAEEKPLKEKDTMSPHAVQVSRTSYNLNEPQKSTVQRSAATHMIKKILSVNTTPIDKISKVAFPCAYIVFNVVYWVYYALSKGTTEDSFILSNGTD